MAVNGELGPGGDDDVAPGEPGLRGDDALVLALATGSTINEAADRAGCSPRTVSRRLAEFAVSRSAFGTPTPMPPAALSRVFYMPPANFPEIAPPANLKGCHAD